MAQVLHNFPLKYITINGQKSQPDSQEQGLVQGAGVLRGTTKEVVKIVNQLKSFPCNDTWENSVWSWSERLRFFR